MTICVQDKGRNQLCTNAGKDILRSIQSYHENQRWYCELAVLMPDHVHLLVSFGNVANYPRIIGDWKRWVARHHGVSWQENFFEHRVREADLNDSKAIYILQNPVRAGLVVRPEDWPFFWQPAV